MNKNIHSAEMHRLADAPQGTKVWYREKVSEKWNISLRVNWNEQCVFITNDAWANIRKAMVDGETVEYKTSSGWVTTNNDSNSICYGSNSTVEKYRIKPDVVEPTYYYKYEMLERKKERIVTTIEHLSDKRANIEGMTEANGWFKIESSKREWRH